MIYHMFYAYLFDSSSFDVTASSQMSIINTRVNELMCSQYFNIIVVSRDNQTFFVVKIYFWIGFSQ